MIGRLYLSYDAIGAKDGDGSFPFRGFHSTSPLKNKDAHLFYTEAKSSNSSSLEGGSSAVMTGSFAATGSAWNFFFVFPK